MKRIVATALWRHQSGLASGAEARAQTAQAGVRMAQAGPPAEGDRVVVERRRLRRVPIYRPDHWDPDVIPRYNPGPNAVRDCTRPMCRSAGRAAR